MLFWKSKSSLEMNIYEVEWHQEGIFPFYTILIVALGLGTCSLPGIRVGKQAECLGRITLYRALCLLCLSSSPSWSCSAFSTPHRKVRLFECMVNSSLTHWCQKHELITGGKMFWVMGPCWAGEMCSWDAAACTLPPFADVTESCCCSCSTGRWAGFLLLLLAPGVISSLWYLSDSVCSRLFSHTV